MIKNIHEEDLEGVLFVGNPDRFTTVLGEEFERFGYNVNHRSFDEAVELVARGHINPSIKLVVVCNKDSIPITLKDGRILDECVRRLNRPITQWYRIGERDFTYSYVSPIPGRSGAAVLDYGFSGVEGLFQKNLARRKAKEGPENMFRYPGSQGNIEGEKATNVESNQLNYDSEFDPNATALYDEEIKCVIPGWEALHSKLETIADQFLPQIPTILELGMGTGLTASRFWNKRPGAHYLGIDFSRSMVRASQDRRDKWARERKIFYPNIEFMFGDYSAGRLPAGNDAVVSVIGIHHQRGDDAKKKLFARIHDCIVEGGSFFFGDLVTYRDKDTAEMNDKQHFTFMGEHARDQVMLDKWVRHHKEQNDLAPLEDQVEWLKEVGFRDVQILYQKFNTALVHAIK